MKRYRTKRAKPNGPKPKKAKMKATNDVIACVVDHGLFFPIAQKLSEQFKHVYYWVDSDRAFPTLREGVIGDGFENVERVSDFWRIKSQCDLFVFPDIGYSGLQHELISQGYPVWGSRGYDLLETSRQTFLDTLKQLSLPVPKYEKVRGINALREFLKDKEDRYIKVSKWRGDCETFHWRDWGHDESTLDCYAYKLGPAKELLTFFVFEPIDAIVEDGIDTYCINGKLPETCFHAIESKDKALIGSVVKMDTISEKVRGVTETFAPVLANYRNFFSTEVRVTDDESYFIDPTLRAGSPPSQVMMELYSNLGEIIWAGSQGDLIEPRPTAEFGGQLMISTHGDPEEWAVADIPESIRQWVKCGHCAEINGRLCAPPDHCLSNDFGWLVALGDSIEAVIENLKDYSEQLPDGFTVDCAALASILQDMEHAESEGIEFADEDMPDPAIAIK